MASSLFGPSGGQNQEIQNGLTQRIQNAKTIMQSLNGASNPQQMLSMMASGNPAIKNILDLVAKHNGDPREAFYALAREKGVNPDDIINSLKS